MVLNVKLKGEDELFVLTVDWDGPGHDDEAGADRKMLAEKSVQGAKKGDILARPLSGRQERLVDVVVKRMHRRKIVRALK